MLVLFETAAGYAIFKVRAAAGGRAARGVLRPDGSGRGRPCGPAWLGSAIRVATRENGGAGGEGAGAYEEQ